MLKFFRKIRQSLLAENKISKYLIYAIGEIVLVVIGILIALSINNRNEEKKSIKVEKQLLENLVTSLKKDSTEIARILPFQINSVKQHNKIIKSKATDITNSYSEEEISEILYELWLGGYSFFPKYGAYNSIISSKGIDIIKSESIKSKLFDLYDYEYKRYESIDIILDNRFQNILTPFLIKEIGFYVNSDYEHNIINKNRFENKYDELQIECKNLTSQSTASLMLLRSMQNNVNTLVKELKTEMNK